MLIIDGSHGEGGGALLRNALSLSAVLGQETRVENIRARRRNPGLQAQHLTAVRALGAACKAELEGAELGSQSLTFRPRSRPGSGEYAWDVAAARRGGSAGSTSLVFQALAVPLLCAEGDSTLLLRGGTHVAWSPPLHYLHSVYLPMLEQMGAQAQVDIERWGWYPQGGGLMTARIAGLGHRFSSLKGISIHGRGPLKRLSGISATSNLPAHIAQRQKAQAEKVLGAEGLEVDVELIDSPAQGQGTLVFFLAEFEKARAGFTALGRKGKPAERVADEACQQFLDYYHSGAALDQHLADQLVIPLALVKGPSSFTTCRITQHLLTNAWIVEQFLGQGVNIKGAEGEAGEVSIPGQAHV